ncbi:hypothetical protein D3C81_1172860 [compost metagenome]
MTARPNTSQNLCKAPCPTVWGMTLRLTAACWWQKITVLRCWVWVKTWVFGGRFLLTCPIPTPTWSTVMTSRVRASASCIPSRSTTGVLNSRSPATVIRPPATMISQMRLRNAIAMKTATTAMITTMKMTVIWVYLTGLNHVVGLITPASSTINASV